MRIKSSHYATSPSGEVVEIQPRDVFKQKQLCSRLKALANEEYQLMVKIKMLANTLKKPAFTEIIENADYFSDRIMDTLNHYTYYIGVLENTNIHLPAIVKPCEIKEYAGWVDRVKEIIKMHAYLKNQIVDVFIAFKEEDYPDVFHFLKQQLALHEDQLWLLRNQIDF